MPKFRKRPVEVEAFCIGRDPLPDWFMDKVSDCTIALHGEYGNVPLTSCSIKTLEGVMKADPGDYIVKGVAGEIYPCKPDIFAATYEPAPEGGAS